MCCVMHGAFQTSDHRILFAHFDRNELIYRSYIFRNNSVSFHVLYINTPGGRIYCLDADPSPDTCHHPNY